MEDSGELRCLPLDTPLRGRICLCCRSNLVEHFGRKSLLLYRLCHLRLLVGIGGGLILLDALYRQSGSDVLLEFLVAARVRDHGIGIALKVRSARKTAGAIVLFSFISISIEARHGLPVLVYRNPTTQWTNGAPMG